MAGPAKPSPPRLFRWGKLAVQGVILIVVAWGIWRTMGQAVGQLADAGVRPRDLHPGWLAFSAVCYLVGLYPCSSFWRRVLQGMGQQPGYGEALRAYFASQPGKYVPGKFMVVLLRTALIQGPGVNATLAAAGTFVETLTMMSLGAVVGAVLMPLALTADWRLVAFALTAAAAAGVPTLPPVFRQLARWTKLHRLHPEIDQALAGLHISELAAGWAGIAAGWIAMGVSLWAATRSIPGLPVAENLAVELMLLTASASLSTVAGFASGLPGGLGAREWVVMALVAPRFGGPVAVLSAVIHRCVMVVAELMACVLVLLLSPRARPAGAEETR